MHTCEADLLLFGGLVASALAFFKRVVRIVEQVIGRFVVRIGLGVGFECAIAADKLHFLDGSLKCIDMSLGIALENP